MTPLDVCPFVRAALETHAGPVLILDAAGAVVYGNEAAREWQGEQGIARVVGDPSRSRSIIVAGRVVGTLLVPDATNGTLEQRERQAILDALRAARWRRAEACRRLGMSRTTLWRRLRRYALG